MNIFGTYAGTVSSSTIGTPTDATIATVTMAIKESGASGEDSTVTLITAHAPVLRCRVNESVDYSIGKALSSDFIVTSFGDLPVELSISGMTIMEVSCGSTSATNPDKGNDNANKTKTLKLSELWNKYSFSSNPDVRFSIGISTNSGSFAYKCILLKATLDADEHTIPINGTNYQFVFYGVRL